MLERQRRADAFLHRQPVAVRDSERIVGASRHHKQITTLPISHVFSSEENDHGSRAFRSGMECIAATEYCCSQWPPAMQSCPVPTGTVRVAPKDLRQVGRTLSLFSRVTKAFPIANLRQPVPSSESIGIFAN